uniref:PKD domain-containing protein n=1 Tax=Eubacterium sp. TaxID=142586 RepID=UPI0025E9F5B2
MRRIIGNFKNNKKLGIGKRFVAVLLSSALFFTSFDLQVFADELNNGKNFFYCGEKYETIYDVLEEARDKGDKNIEVLVSGELKLTKGIDIKNGEKVIIKSGVITDNGEIIESIESGEKQKFIIDGDFNPDKDGTSNANLFNVEKDASLTLDGFTMDGYYKDEKDNTVRSTLPEKRYNINCEGDFSYTNGIIKGFVFKKNPVINVNGGRLDFTGSKISDLYCNNDKAFINASNTSYITGGYFSEIYSQSSFNSGGLVKSSGILVMDNVQTYLGYVYCGGLIRAERLYMNNCKIEGSQCPYDSAAVHIIGKGESKIYNSEITGGYCSWGPRNGTGGNVSVDNGDVYFYGVKIGNKCKEESKPSYGIKVNSGSVYFEKNGEYDDEYFGKIETDRNIIDGCERGINVSSDGKLYTNCLDMMNNYASKGAAIYNEGYVELDDVSFKGNNASLYTSNKQLNKVKYGDDIYNNGELTLKENIHFEDDDNVHILLGNNKSITVKDEFKYHNNSNNKINIGFESDISIEEYNFVYYDGKEGLSYEAVNNGVWYVISVSDEKNKDIIADENRVYLCSEYSNVSLKVIDDSNKNVSGAVFELWKQIEGNKYKYISTTGASDDDGKIFVGKLIKGNYALKCLSLSADYNIKNVKTLEFEVDEDRELNINVGRLNKAPVAKINIDKEANKINAYEEIEFSASESTDDTGIVSYSWDFGEGSDGDGNYANGITVKHRYTSAGMRMVTLTVKDKDGKTSTETLEINVSGDGLVSVTVEVKSTDTDEYIPNSYIYITDEDNKKIAEKNSAIGICEFLTTPNRKVNITAAADGYYSRTTSAVCKENGKAVIYLSTRDTIKGDIKVKELTLDEIKNAGIDIEDESNRQIVKYELDLTFVEIKGPVKAESFSFFVNKDYEVIDVEGNYRSKYGDFSIEPGVDEYNHNLYFMIIRGTNTWLKDMFEVELMVVNNSEVEIAKDVNAEIKLPDGLSLAKMNNGGNDKNKSLGDIDTKNSASTVWYVRGDIDGSYLINAEVTGKMHKKDETSTDEKDNEIDNQNEDYNEIEIADYEFKYLFQSKEYVNVYMQSALGVLIELEKTAATGGSYTIRFNYFNKSPKSIYDLNFAIDEEIQLSPGNTTYGKGLLSIGKVDDIDNITDTPLPLGMPVDNAHVDELKPGEFIGVTYKTQVTFLNEKEEDVITELASYGLKILEGSTASMDVYFSVITTAKDSANIEEATRKNSMDVFGGDPINLLTGSFESEFDDLNISGYRYLDFKRFYNSQDDYNESFGRGWRHNYDYVIEDYGIEDLPIVMNGSNVNTDNNEYSNDSRKSCIQIRCPDGRLYNFEKISNGSYDYDVFDKNGKVDDEKKFNGLDEGKYTSKEGSTLEVIKKNDKIDKILMNDKGVVYTFNSNKKLISIKDSEGFETKLVYDGGLLKEISNDTGKIEVSWNYVIDRISEICFTKDGKTIKIEYAYENNNLISEKNPNGDLEKYEYIELDEDTDNTEENSDKKEYAKSESVVNGALVSKFTIGDSTKNNDKVMLLKTITDYNGNVVIKNSYDNKRRVKSQVVNGKGTFSYIYDEINKVNTQIGFKNCKREIKYNDSKQVVSDLEKVDENVRSKTTYEYNSDGLPVIIVENDNMDNKNKRVIAYNSRQDICKVAYADKTSESFVYDTSEDYLLMSSTDRNGVKTEYSYDDNNLLTEKKVVDTQNTKDVYKTLYKYDSSNRLLSEIVDGNTLKTIKYYSDGRIKNIKDGEGFITSFSYDALGNVISSTNNKGESVNYTYDYRGVLKAIKDEYGKSIEYTLDKNGKVTDVKDKRDNTESMKLNVAGDATIYTSKLGNKTKYEYDDYGNLVKTTNPDESTVELSYDAYGNVVSKSDENKNKWKYAYDKSNRLSKEINPQGLTVEYEYDVDGNVVSKKYLDKDGNLIEDANGNSYVEEYSYDKVGRIKTEKDGNGNIKKYEYDANGNLTVYIDENNIATYNTYDENNNLIESKTGDKTYSYVYDLNGNVKKETATKIHLDGDNLKTEKHVKEYTYDFRGNVKSYIDEHNNKTTYEYDKVGNLIEIIYCDDTYVEYTYDDNSNLTSTKDRNGNVCSYEYDKEDRLIKETNGDREYGYSYDYAGRVTEKTYPEGKKENYEYDSVGNLITVTTNENIIKYTRDKLGRILTESIEDADGDTNKIEKYKNTYDILGNLTETDYTKINGEYKDKIKYTYDVNGRVIRKVDSNGNKYFYEYDGKGNVTKEKYNTGKVISYTYDVDNNVIEKCISYDGKVVKKSNKTSSSDDGNDSDDEGSGDIDDAILENTKIVYLYDYDLYGNLVSYTDGNGNVTKCEYNDKDNTKKITDALGNYTEFTYDAFNNLKTKKSSGMIDESYDYDKNNNLIKVTDSNGSITKYSYDENNNITKKIEVDEKGDGNRIISYEYDNLDRCIKITYPDASTEKYEYNIFDKVTSKVDSKNNETKYDYDYRGNLIKVTEPMGNSIKYSYDCNDNLSEIIKNNGSIKYTYDGCKNIVLETDELGNKKEYTYDCFGNVIKENNDIGSVSYAYDLNGNNIRKTIITGKHIENYNYSYDNNNELIEFSSDVNSKNNTVNITRDALSNIVSVCDGNKTVKYGYDKDNNNTSVVYPNGDKVSYEYNNGKIKTIKTLNDKFEYEYNSFNEVISKKSNHINEKYEYDKLGRLIKKYEGDALRESLKYDTLNNLISKEEYKGSSSKKTEYSYDKNGRLTTETTEKGDKKNTTKYQYDTNSNLVKETKGNKVVEYSYDNGDRLSSRVESISSSKTGTNNQKTIEYNYDVLGDLLSEKSDSYNKTYSYNADGKLTSSYVLLDIKKNDKGNKTDIETTEKIDNTYLYNALGLLIEKTSSRKTDYKYKNNPLGYVKSDIETKNYIKDEQYLYDYTNANPTVLSSEISVSSTDEDDYYYEKNILSILKYSDENTITSTDKQYKINSNYVYEGDKKISVSLSVDGEINKKTTKKTTSLFGKTVVKEDGDNNSDKYSTEYTLITDSKGSVIKALDLTGNTAGEVTYGSFGNVEDIDIKESDDILAEELKTSDILPSYTSYVYSDELKSLQDEKISSTVYGDSESKDLGDETGYNKYTTWYAYERFYSTIDKRFISKDPVVGSIDEPNRVNSYIYAGDNPLTYVDRDGRSFTCEITNNRFF